MITGAFYSVKEAAKELGCSEGHIRYLFRAGSISGQKISERVMLINIDSLKAFSKLTMETGRPRKNSA